nr:MAG TPA: hypothetical protein [Caudoviricetes sp.]
MHVEGTKKAQVRACARKTFTRRLYHDFTNNCKTILR